MTLIGDYESDDNKLLESEWTWKWTPPHNMDEIHRGWRNHCCVCRLFLIFFKKKSLEHLFDDVDINDH